MRLLVAAIVIAIADGSSAWSPRRATSDAQGRVGAERPDLARVDGAARKSGHAPSAHTRLRVGVTTIALVLPAEGASVQGRVHQSGTTIADAQISVHLARR